MKILAQILGRSVAGALLFFGLGVATATHAAILPDTIGYEGYLRDAGNPVNTPQNLTFRLYDQENGGTALWTESHAAVPVTNGVFQVRLGSVVSLSDDVTGINFDRALFLSVQVEGSAEMTPRLALNISPYSFAGRLLDSVVSVDCDNGGSIAEILEQAGDTFRLEIDISGNCVGNLRIDRDKVTITSTDGTGVITGVTPADPDSNPGNATVTVLGVQNVTFDDVEIVGAPGDDTEMRGILLADNAQVTVRGGSVVRNHNGDGITLVEASSLDVWGSTVQDNGLKGISVYSGSHADIERGRTEADPEDEPPSVIQNNGGNGVDIALGSSADIRGSTIQGNGAHGVIASWSSTVRIRDESTVQDNGTPGENFGSGNYHTALFINEGSSGRVENSVISTDMINARHGPAVAVYRGSALRFRGENTISANEAATVECPPTCSTSAEGVGGMAMDVEMNSTVRQDGGKSTINGQLYSFNLSTIDIRNAAITALQIRADGTYSNIRLRDQSTDDDDPTVNGTVYVNDITSIRDANNSERAIINGNVFCRSSNSFAPRNLQFTDPATQGYLNCSNIETDLDMEIVGPAGEQIEGSVLEYTVTVENPHEGGDPMVEAINTHFNFSADNHGGFSGDLSITGINDPGGACGFDGFNVNCFKSSLAAGETYTFMITVDLPDFGTGDFHLNGSLSANNPDDDFSNNNVSLNTVVNAP